ncbi:hypothetical protein ACF1GY_14000 [Streptomyces sp. NPDC014684]|uniref:hypothetical protein n=1 Tax=Streptomyces sp. NPDC014684 TaxID=3364880 RepID=UPI0036FDF339
MARRLHGLVLVASHLFPEGRGVRAAFGPSLVQQGFEAVELGPAVLSLPVQQVFRPHGASQTLNGAVGHADGRDMRTLSLDMVWKALQAEAAAQKDELQTLIDEVTAGRAVEDRTDRQADSRGQGPAARRVRLPECGRLGIPLTWTRRAADSSSPVCWCMA